MGKVMISKDYAVYKALKLLENKKPERPSEFARIMWPNSPRWTRRVKCGRNGVSVGGGMNLAGGAFLGKLRKANLISYYYPDDYATRYILTSDGQQAIKDFEENSSILFDTSAYPYISSALTALSDSFLMTSGEESQLVIFAHGKQIPCSPVFSTQELDDFCKIYQDHYQAISGFYNEWIARHSSMPRFPEFWLFNNPSKSMVFVKNGFIFSLHAFFDSIKLLLEQDKKLSIDDLMVFTSKGLTYSAAHYKHDDFLVVSAQDKYKFNLAISNQVDRYEVMCIGFTPESEDKELLLFSSDNYRKTKQELRSLMGGKPLKRDS